MHTPRFRAGRSAALGLALFGAALSLGGCTWLTGRPEPSPAQEPLVGGRPVNPAAPNYPVEYVTRPRAGEVLARCDAGPKGTRMNCRVIGEEGGEAFSNAMLSWLASPDATPVAELSPATSFHDYFVLFPAPGAAPQTDTPVRVLASGPAGGNFVVQADCAFGWHGGAWDCRVLNAPDAASAHATIAALEGGGSGFWHVWQGGVRRIVTVGFRPGAA